MTNVERETVQLFFNDVIQFPGKQKVGEGGLKPRHWSVGGLSSALYYLWT
jgi:hypothetical protein